MKMLKKISENSLLLGKSYTDGIIMTLCINRSSARVDGEVVRMLQYLQHSIYHT